MAAGSQVTTVREKARDLYLRNYAKRGFFSDGATCQDLWIALVVHPGRRGGFFVDVGAGDGVFGNNTFLLEQRLDWSGLCIEPQPSYHGDLRRWRRAQLVTTAVSDRQEVVQLACAGFFGGIVRWLREDQADNWREAPRLMAPAAPLAHILDVHDAPPQIDYLSLDIEGGEVEVLRAFPFERYAIAALSVESPERDEVAAILAPHGYVEVSNPFARMDQEWERFFVRPDRVHPRAVQPRCIHAGRGRGESGP